MQLSSCRMGVLGSMFKPTLRRSQPIVWALPLSEAGSASRWNSSRLKPESRKMRRPDMGKSMTWAGTASDTDHRPQTSADASGPRAIDVAESAHPAPSASQVERFHALYREHFDFVFRNLRRLGVAEAQIDDAVQDAF